MRFALSSAKSRGEASLMIGMKKADFIHYIKEYGLTEKFKYDSKTRKSR